jgi:RNA polymerase sigma-70 factor (ECF subfamily)
VDTGERALIRQAQQGDTAAFEALVNIHAPLVYNLALRTLNDPHEAEDMAQETFIRAWQSLPRFLGKSRFSTWLYRIVTNLCYNRLPQLKVELAALEPAEEIELTDEHQAVEASLLTAERCAHLHSAIDALPDSGRLLITLRHLQGMAYTEIADVTDMPLGSVKTGIFRARRRLRDALESYEGSDNERIQ